MCFKVYDLDFSIYFLILVVNSTMFVCVEKNKLYKGRLLLQAHTSSLLSASDRYQ